MFAASKTTFTLWQMPILKNTSFLRGEQNQNKIPLEQLKITVFHSYRITVYDPIEPLFPVCRHRTTFMFCDGLTFKMMEIAVLT